jgi:WD40 repeat protein
MAGLELAEEAFDLEKIPEAAEQARRFNERLTKGRLTGFRVGERSFKDVVLDDLRHSIVERFPDHAHERPEGELDQQEKFLLACTQDFVARQGDFDDLDRYAEGSSNTLLVLRGEGGMGKSTLLANWIDRRRRDDPSSSNTPTLMFRFIGQSDMSSSLRSLLTSLLSEMESLWPWTATDIPDDLDLLKHSWTQAISSLEKVGRVTIVLDGLNQLGAGFRDIYWIPRRLPPNVRFVVSMKSDHWACEELCERFGSQILIQAIKPYEDLNDRRRLVQAYLSKYLKQLDNQHLEAVIGSEGASNPLFLKVVLSELRVFGSFAGLAEKIRNDFGTSPVTAFHRALQRIESDPMYSAIEPGVATPIVFGLLSHARNGLSGPELAALLRQCLHMPENEATDDVVADAVNVILRQVRPFLSTRDGRHDFFYESFRTASRERYAGSDSGLTKATWHKRLADYFWGLPMWQSPGKPTARKTSELPHHLSSSHDWARLSDTLCGLDFIQAKLASGLPGELLSDYQEAASEAAECGEALPSVRTYRDFVRSRMHVLSRRPQSTLQEAANFRGSRTLSERAEQSLDAGISRPWFRWRNKHQYQEKISPLTSFLGHTASVYSCSVSSDGRRLASGGWDGLRIWDYETAQQIEIDPVFRGHCGYVAFTEAGLWVSTWKMTDRFASFHLLEHGTWRELSALDLPDDKFRGATVSPDGKLLADTKGNEISITQLGTKQILVRLQSRSPEALSVVAFSPDGHLLAAVSRFGGKLDLWATDTWSKVVESDGIPMPDVRSCFLAPDNSSIYLVRSDGILALGIPHLKARDVIQGHSRPIEGGCHAPSGPVVLSCSRDGAILAWEADSSSSRTPVGVPAQFRDYPTKQTCFTSCEWSTAALPSGAISSDGKLAVLTRAGEGLGLHDTSRLDLQRTIEPLDALAFHKGHYPSTLAFSPSGDVLLAGYASGRIKTFGLGTDDGSSTYDEAHSYAVLDCAFSHDGATFVTCSEDRSVQLWSVGRGHSLSGRLAHQGIVYGCCISPDSKTVVTVSDDRTVRFWEGLTLRSVAILRPGRHSFRSCSFSHDGKRLAVGTDSGAICILDFKKRTLAGELNGHPSPVVRCQWLPGDRDLLVAFRDGTLAAIDVDTGSLGTWFKAEGELLSSSFSADGHAALLTTANNMAYLLDFVEPEGTHEADIR